MLGPEYYRQRAQLCRDMAMQMSDNQTAAWLRAMSRNYDAEADCLEQHQPLVDGTNSH